MIDQIHSNIVTSYLVFVHDFADPSSVDQAKIEEKMHGKVEDLFKRQRTADLAKKRLGADFDKAVALYFNRFVTKDGLQHTALLNAIKESEGTLALHLKKDAVRFVRLLAQLMALVDTKPKGLLAS